MIPAVRPRRLAGHLDHGIGAGQLRIAEPDRVPIRSTTRGIASTRGDGQSDPVRVEGMLPGRRTQAGWSTRSGSRTTATWHSDACTPTVGFGEWSGPSRIALDEILSCPGRGRAPPRGLGPSRRGSSEPSSCCCTRAALSGGERGGGGWGEGEGCWGGGEGSDESDPASWSPDWKGGRSGVVATSISTRTAALLLWSLLDRQLTRFEACLVAVFSTKVPLPYDVLEALVDAARAWSTYVDRHCGQPARSGGGKVV